MKAAIITNIRIDRDVSVIPTKSTRQTTADIDAQPFWGFHAEEWTEAEQISNEFRYNVLIDDRGRVHLADFGLAVAEGDNRLTLTGELVGRTALTGDEIGDRSEGSTFAQHRGMIAILRRNRLGTAVY